MLSIFGLVELNKNNYAAGRTDGVYYYELLSISVWEPSVDKPVFG